jgi:eukaryotic-like serine/threonine-protein kinase
MVCLLRIGINGGDDAQQDSISSESSYEHFGVYVIKRYPDGSLHELGRGAMGVTYRATDTSLQRDVALKVIKAEAGGPGGERTEARERFMREARTAAALRHENIATVFQFGICEETGQCFYAMELIDGETLDERVRRTGPLDVRTVIEIAQQVAAALGAAEKRGLIHRDLKPANLMLIDGDQPDLPTVKIIDFGLAKVLDAPVDPTRLTHMGFIGTPAFASPEQFDNEALDVRSDIYSLGATLWFALTGKTPFGRHTADEIHQAQQSNVLPLEQLKAAHVPSRLRSLLESMLALEPAARPSVRDLEVCLQRCATHADNARRRRIALAAAFILILGVACAILISRPLRTHPAAAGSVSIPVMPAKSIAVLPFDNQNRDRDTDYLSDGIPESIINSLSELSQLKVMARSTVFQYKGKQVDPRKVGQDLGVRAVLMGRLIQQGENLTIRTELVNVSDGRQLWGQQYNRKLADVFAVQEEIAREISETLRLKLTDAERQQLAKRPTENLKAFQYYMQGRTLAPRHTREDLLTAISYYEKALAEDPNYSLGYAGLADAYAVLGGLGYIAPIDGRRKAEEAARKALALDDNLAEAHAVLGAAYILFCPAKFALGDGELRRAIERSPSLALAHQYLGVSLARQGRLDESLKEYSKARELDPLSSISARVVALPYYFKRDYVRAVELLRQANELGPSFSTTWEIGVYIQNRLFDEALAELEKAKRQRKNDSVLIYDTGMIYAAQGNRAEALQVIKELEDMSGANLSEALWIAKIYASLNEKEMAFSWLERGLATGALAIFYKDEPVWDSIRSDTRFRDLLQRIGIPRRAAESAHLFGAENANLAAPEKSIAVLPFENRSRDPDNAYFADGIHDEILTSLSKVADLKVISRTSTQHYKSTPENLPEIARQLGVAHNPGRRCAKERRRRARERTIN